MSGMLARVRTYASFVRVSHSVFALPFALVGTLLAARQVRFEWSRLIWIVVCMVAARSAAMGFNRLADAAFDARNPRTAGRELPAGRMRRGEAIAFVAVASAAFVASSAQLGRVCLVLSPLALAIVFWYSLAKRYTSYTQAFLGLAMAVAPVGGWIAAGGPPSVQPWLLGLAIGTWVAGFDILYACQDLDVDRREGLRSIPVRFGIPRSLLISRVLHLVTVVTLVTVGTLAGLNAIYLVGVGIVALLLVWEQSLVRADDLSQVKRAFDVNGWVGLLYLFTTAAAVYWS
jgi:4-hydroxybenzoate polyprenyltransferase